MHDLYLVHEGYHSRVGLINQGKVRVADERDPFENADCADDEGKVGGDAERVVKCDLCKICG